MDGALARMLRERAGIEPRACAPLAGGCVGEVYRVSAAGRDVVVKVDRRSRPLLDIEGRMLRCLAEHSSLPVPGVLLAEPDLLVMEFVEGESRFNRAAQEHAARLLAALHGVEAPAFGLGWETLIGGLPQPNPWTPSWIDFFRDARLLHMADRALAEGVMPAPLHRRLRAFAERLGDWLEEPERPALLHGDVWTTNVLARDGRVTAFIDPAVYYGHPEVELAFITLFNTFGDSFFDAYHALRPIRPGFFELRRDIHNLYPLLVHARLFGSSYLDGVERVIARLGF